MSFWQRLFRRGEKDDAAQRKRDARAARDAREEREERAKRPREPEDPPALAGVGAPLLPRTPQLSGGNARKIPPED
jgi:hypothetical protein